MTVTKSCCTPQQGSGSRALLRAWVLTLPSAATVFIFSAVPHAVGTPPPAIMSFPLPLHICNFAAMNHSVNACFLVASGDPRERLLNPQGVETVGWELLGRRSANELFVWSTDFEKDWKSSFQWGRSHFRLIAKSWKSKIENLIHISLF